jgi:ABC-type branched-subunit amino acid transport system substrate-binding protein
MTNPAKYPFLFSIIPTPLDLSKIAITYIAERSDIKVRKPKVIFIGSPEYIDRHFLEEVKAYAYASGLEVGPDVSVSEIPQAKPAPSSGQTGLTSPAFISTIKRYNPDFVYLSLTPREAVHILQEVKDLGLKTKWIGNTRAFDETLMPFEGVWEFSHLRLSGGSSWNGGIKEVHQRWHPYNTHTLSYTEGWATVQVMAEALRRSLPEERFSDERMKGCLESFQKLCLRGIIPPITITPRIIG